MSQYWVRHRERGSVLAMKLIAWLALVFGRGFARLLLYPICVYFMILSRGAGRASRDYLSRVLGRGVRLRDVFLHHYYFASMLLDRGLLLAGRDERFQVTSHGLDMMLRLADRGRGCLLLGAHLGSFELTRTLGVERRGLVVNMMMYEENARKINTVIESLGGKQRMRVIPIGAVDALIQAKSRIDDGEWLAILGDRVVANDRLVRVPFLGQEAVFPGGPFLVANALKIPVVLFVCLYRGGDRYEEHFELLAEEVVLDRHRRQADLEKYVTRYARRLEHYCRRSPYNWFNFYDFWEQKPADERKAMIGTPA